MQIQQLNQSDAERVLIVVQNKDGGGSITTGHGACLVATAASGDGVQAVRSLPALAETFTGVALKDIAINAFGLATAWGYAASIALSQSVGSWTITSGDVLKLDVTAPGTFTSVITDQAISTQLYKYVIALGAVADTISNPRPYMEGLVRAI